jgi:hypothetical protein
MIALGCGCSSAGQSYQSKAAPAQSYGGTYYAMSDDVVEGQLTSADSVQTVAESSGPARVRASTARASSRTPEQIVQEAGRKLVRNASLLLEVKNESMYPTTIKQIGEIAASMEGYTQSETERTILILVPTERLDEAIKRIEPLGEIKSRNISVQDVTTQYVDLQIRIDNLRRLRDRLTDLIEQSAEVKDILEVEKELARVTSQLEQLEGQLRGMEKRTAFATINVALDKRVSPGPIGWIFYGIAVGIKWLFVWD